MTAARMRAGKKQTMCLVTHEGSCLIYAMDMVLIVIGINTIY